MDEVQMHKLRKKNSEILFSKQIPQPFLIGSS